MSLRLLYVEDDHDLRAMLEVLLRREGYDVRAVAAAEDAVVELQRGGYQLLLTDYNLPNKNANWMLQVARASGSLQKVEVVVLTATPEPEGVDGYRVLRKPVDLSLLLATLDQAVIALEQPVEASCESAASDGSTVMLTLYVTAASRDSTKALRNLRRVIQKFDARRVRLAVCDVTNVDGPASARLEADRVVVTPTLVRQYPEPKVWVFGDLSKDEPVDDMIATGLDRLEHGA